MGKLSVSVSFRVCMVVSGLCLASICLFVSLLVFCLPVSVCMSVFLSVFVEKSFQLVHIASLWRTCVTAQTHQRPCVGSSVHQTVSSHVHHLHGRALTTARAGAAAARTTNTTLLDQQHDRAGEHGRVNSASTPAHAVGRRTTAKACSTGTTTATGYQKWRDDIRAVVGTRQACVAAAFK